MAVWEGKLVAHTGIIQAPLKQGVKRVHRLVVLPEFQGIGIGTAFISQVAEIVAKRGVAVQLVTTTPSLVGSLCKDDRWCLTRYGRVKGYLQIKGISHLASKDASSRMTYSFYYRRQDA